MKLASGGIALPFLTSALDGGERSALSPGRFITREGTPGTHWIGGCVDPRAGLDTVEKRKTSWPCQESNSGREAHSLSLYRLSYPGSTIIIHYFQKYKIDLCGSHSKSITI
jgi:hypothetical protein